MESKLFYLVPIVSNIIRYFLFAGIPFLIFYVLFPEKFSNNKIQEKFAKHKDFMREIWHSMQTSVIIGVIIALIIFSPLRDYTQLYSNMADYPLWWIPLSVVVALVIHDTYFYWMHRAMHHPKLYKKAHLVHHQSVNPSPWTSFSFHFIEGVTEAMIAPILIFMLPMHPLALAIFGLSSFFINVYGHLGFEIAPRWFRSSLLFEIVNTSVHHNLHHEKFNGNYGLYFRLWDRLMGTEQKDYVAQFDRIHAQRFGTSYAAPSLAKKMSLPLILLLSLFGFSVFGQTSIEGKWKDNHDGGVIMVYKKGEQYFGQLISADKPEEQARLEGHTVIVMKDFDKKSDTEYCCGTLYQPKEDRIVSGNLTLLDEKTLKIKGRYGIFTGTRIWKRL